MNDLNYTFFEEYKKLEKLCNDIYKSHNGVTNYIDDMNKIPSYIYKNIFNFEKDLSILKQLRHIRNKLAHETDAFNTTICKTEDIEWLKTFYERILNQTDPLALNHQKTKIKTIKALPTPNLNEPYNNDINKDNELLDFDSEENSISNGLFIFVILILFVFIISTIISCLKLYGLI